jgi:hypothetical protein
MTDESPIFEDRKKAEIAQLRMQATAAGVEAQEAHNYLDQAERMLPNSVAAIGEQIDELLGRAKAAIFKAEKNG